jgi:hypothetical protein
VSENRDTGDILQTSLSASGVMRCVTFLNVAVFRLRSQFNNMKRSEFILKHEIASYIMFYKWFFLSFDDN